MSRPLGHKYLRFTRHPSLEPIDQFKGKETGRVESGIPKPPEGLISWPAHNDLKCCLTVVAVGELGRGCCPGRRSESNGTNTSWSVMSAAGPGVRSSGRPTTKLTLVASILAYSSPRSQSWREQDAEQGFNWYLSAPGGYEAACWV